jgi:hypothetical protein
VQANNICWYKPGWTFSDIQNMPVRQREYWSATAVWWSQKLAALRGVNSAS